MGDKRDAALKKAKDYKAHTAEVQKKQEAKTKAIDAIDNELGNAMCDTTECQLPTGKCVKTKCNGGSKYYLNTDLVTCTTTKPPATTFAPSSSACKAAVAAFAKKYGAVPASSSLSAVACSAKKTDRKAEIAVRAKVLMFLKVKETCPEECNGSVKVTEMDDSTHTQQNCVPQSFYTGMVSMFDLKARKKSGTGGRFAPGCWHQVPWLLRHLQGPQLQACPSCFPRGQEAVSVSFAEAASSTRNGCVERLPRWPARALGRDFYH